MFPALLEQLRRHEDLTADQAFEVMSLIMDGQALPSQIAGLLMALALKGERPSELAGFARAMRSRAVRVDEELTDVFDTCGTGGDGTHTFNVSTAAAIVVAGAGVRVAKHGNRSVSSKSGSADVLEALGANINLKPEQVGRCIDATGVGFMFAPNHHAAMKHAAPVRRELGVKTIFNILGPLTNPAGAGRQLMGVFHRDLVGIQARVLQRLGSRHVMIVYGEEGLDEISLSGPTLVGELKEGSVNEYSIAPQDFGLKPQNPAAIKVDGVEQSKAMVLSALANEAGAARDIVALNAGAGIYVAGLAPTLAGGVQKALAAIASGAARKKLDAFVGFTQSQAGG
jgi:anthranilate phosphoribosyltransferase